MSESSPYLQDPAAQGPQGQPFGAPAPVAVGRQPVARLSTWVNVVLVLILFASCSAASQSGNTVTEVIHEQGSESVATTAEVAAMCRLLGAAAVKQGIDLDAALAGGEPGTACEAAARQPTQQ